MRSAKARSATPKGRGSTSKVRASNPFPSAIIAQNNPEALVTAAAYDSLRLFVEAAWPIVVPAEPFQPNWHIDAICEHLEAVASLQIKNLLINVPPRFGKSTIVSVLFPAWLWARNPSLRLLYSSYAQALSTRDALATRRLIESPWYQSKWGWVYRITTDQNEKMRFENNKRGYRLATSVGGANTGEGGDFIVCDDPHNVREVESDTVRAGVLKWWNEVMSTRGNNPATTRRIVIMQRAHEEDVAGNILAQGGYEHLNLPMEYETKFSKVTAIGWADPRTTDGDLLWPERYNAAWVGDQRRIMGAYGFAAQFQQRPAPLEGGMFKRSWWRFYRTDPALLLEKANDKCWSWDMAFKDKSESDFVCGLALARVGADIYVLHATHDRLSFTASKQAVKTGATKFPRIIAKLVEDKANGTAIVDDLRSTVGGLIAVEPEGGKEARAWVVQPYAEAGNIYLPETAPWVEDFIEEFRVFPNGAHDDYVDALSQGVIWLLNRCNRQSFAYVTSFTKSTSRVDLEPPFRDPRYWS